MKACSLMYDIEITDCKPQTAKCVLFDIRKKYFRLSVHCS